MMPARSTCVWGTLTRKPGYKMRSDLNDLTAQKLRYKTGFQCIKCCRLSASRKFRSKEQLQGLPVRMVYVAKLRFGD